MNCKSTTLLRKSLSPKPDGREGVHAAAFFVYLLIVELIGSGIWFYLSTILVSLDKTLLLHHILTPNQALGIAIVIVSGLGALIYGGLLGTKKGKQFMLAIANAIDKLVIKVIFDVKFFFVSVTYVAYIVFIIHFQTRTPSLPETPPRNHLA